LRESPRLIRDAIFTARAASRLVVNIDARRRTHP
jgi:hypothetical protein